MGQVANVALTDTFNVWVTRTNQLATNLFEINPAANTISANAVTSNTVSANTVTIKWLTVNTSITLPAASINSTEVAFLANTNTYIFSKESKATANTRLANTNIYILSKESKATANTRLANTNTYIATKLTTTAAASTYETKATANTRLANTNTYIATKLTTNANTATDNSLVRYDGTTGKLVKDGAVIGTDVQAYDADTLKADVADVLTAGYAATPYNAGTKTTGTFTPDEANGNMQYAVNGGAHTLAPPTNNCTLVIQYTNDASAGAITVSGFTASDTTATSTTSGDDFFFYITKLNGFSELIVRALQ